MYLSLTDFTGSGMHFLGLVKLSPCVASENDRQNNGRQVFNMTVRWMQPNSDLPGALKCHISCTDTGSTSVCV